MTRHYKVIADKVDWIAGLRVAPDRKVTLSDEAAQYDLARGNIEPIEGASMEPEAQAPPAKKTREG